MKHYLFKFDDGSIGRFNKDWKFTHTPIEVYIETIKKWITFNEWKLKYK